MSPKRTLVSLVMAMILGGAYLSAQSEVQKRPERDRIRENIHRLSDLIEKVLAYAALTATELEQAGQLVPLADLVDRIRQRVAERRVGRYVLGAGHVRVDDRRQAQVVLRGDRRRR